MEKNPNIKRNYIYMLFYQSLQILTPLITAPYVSRILGAANIGVYSFVYANYIYFQLFCTMGIGTYAQLEAAKVRDDIEKLSKLFIEIMITKFCTFGVSVILYLAFIVINGKYTTLYLIQIFLLVATAVDISWLFEGVENFKTVMLRNVIVKLLTIGSILLFVRNKNDLWIYAVIIASGTLLGNLLIFPLLKNYLLLKKYKDMYILVHLKATFVFFLPAIASVLTSTTDKLMIGWITKDELQNGYYEQSTKIETLLFSLFASLNHIMRSRMAYLSINSKKTEILERLNMSLKYVSFIVFPITCGIISVSNIFVPWFFGEEYEAVVGILKIMSLWLIPQALSGCLMEQYIMPNGGQIVVTKIIWLGAFVNTLLNAILISDYKAYGATVASLFAEIIVAIATVFICKKVVTIRKYISDSWKHVLSSISMLVILFPVVSCMKACFLHLVVCILLGIATYVLGLLLMKDSFIIYICKNVLGGMKEKIISYKK